MPDEKKRPLVTLRIILEEIIADENFDQSERDKSIAKIAEMNRAEAKKRFRRRA